VRILATALFLLGAGSLFCAYLFALGAGLCESECTSPTAWEAAFVATGVMLWIGAVIAFRRRQP
jgi:hypothetical protein